MTQVTETSLEAYILMGDPTPNETRVLEVIRSLKVCTDRQIASQLGWTINRVTGRRNNLIKKGLIIQCGHIRCGAYRHRAYRVVE